MKHLPFTPALHHEGMKLCNRNGIVADLGESTPPPVCGLRSEQTIVNTHMYAF